MKNNNNKFTVLFVQGNESLKQAEEARGVESLVQGVRQDQAVRQARSMLSGERSTTPLKNNSRHITNN